MDSIERLADRAAGYGFPGETVDGTRPELVREAVARAAARARAGEGPTLIEAHVRRLGGHHTHDPEQYRPEGEKETWVAASDPVALLRAELAKGRGGEQQVATVESEVEATLAAALERAQAAPTADPASLLEHVYA
jgi:pyruvate dehydrogenase E1 component alpha subunit